MKAYAEWAKRAIAMLEKVNIAKDSLFITAQRRQDGSMEVNSDVFRRNPVIRGEVPRGFAVWILTNIDGTGARSTWNYYWVDADIATTIHQNLLSTIESQKFDFSNQLHQNLVVSVKMADKSGELVTQDELKLSDDLVSNGRWVLFNRTPPNIMRTPPTFTIAPVIGTRNYSDGGFTGYSGMFPIDHNLKITDQELERVSEIIITIANRIRK